MHVYVIRRLLSINMKIGFFRGENSLKGTERVQFEKNSKNIDSKQQMALFYNSL